MIHSLWETTTKMPVFPKLKGNLKTDILIVGGGLAGILCARKLADAGVDCILIEADRICCGVTGNTTAKITSQHGLIYHKIARKYGIHAAKAYFSANNDAVKEYRKLCKDIPCDYQLRDACVYATGSTDKLEKELAVLEQICARYEYRDEADLPFSVQGVIRFPNQGQFHPLQFVSGIVQGLHIYEQTAAKAFVGNTVITDSGKIQASKIVVATHFPILNKHGSYFLKMYQHRSYVLALEGAGQVDGMYIGDEDSSLSFREHNGLLLLGGGSHRTGKQGGNWGELEKFAAKYYPDSRTVYHWAAQDCMTLDGIPYIGKYSKHTPDLYVATGFNKWGISSSMVAANLLRDQLLENNNEFSEIFSPTRTVLQPQLLCNIWESTVNLLTPTAPRCPHLGCALKWNKAEHSWDCPCHGSRFSQDGKLLDNPSTGDMKP